MKIAVCEDCVSEQRVLVDHILKFGKINSLALSIDLFSNAEELLESAKKIFYPIVFLDIYMDKMTGIEVAEILRNNGCKSKIILTTTSTDHMFEGFKIAATHYLLKPIGYSGVENALERCGSQLKIASKKLDIVTDKKTLSITLKNIRYIDIYSNISTIHLKDEQIKLYMSLADLEKVLDERFLRTHRSYIVNMDYINKINNCDFVLSDGTLIPIRKNGKNDVTYKYKEYLFETLRNG